MFKYQTLQKGSYAFLAKSTRALLRPHQQLLFSSQTDKSQKERDFTKQFLLAGAVSAFVAYKLSRKENSQAEKNQEEKEELKDNIPPRLNIEEGEEYSQPKKPQLFQPFLQKALDTFEIPKLLKEREQQKKQEYSTRHEEDIRKIDGGMSDADIQELKMLDNIYGQDKLNEDDDDEEDTPDYLRDPYTQKKNIKMRHQEYRTIKVGPVDLLKNGQMIQVSVCDPFDENTFHPTDKVIIAKHNNQYYAVGSFCGFDYTSLATGAFLGDKLICPTCGSTYNIENGFVDQGPSLRNISSFNIQQREEKVQIVIPEHVPAFAHKKFIKRQIIDPRTFVVLGDSETALAAIDALRTAFTGKIVVIPSSPFGQFENVDVLNRKFTPLQKNEVYMVEEDYLNRANVEVVAGDVKTIDLNKKLIVVRGQKQPIEFDKVLVAWGSFKKRINSANTTQYSNVYYLEDRFSHAKCHNEILKAKCIAIMGGTFEAYQTASSIRDYLDSIGYTETQIILLDSQISEVQQCLGFHIAGEIHSMLREKRITVMMKAEITKIRGIDKIEQIQFKKLNPREDEKDVEFFIKPDLVIAENGTGAPKKDLKALLAPANNAEDGEPPINVAIDPKGVPASDTKFSLHYNDIHTPIFAAGSCTQYPSFMHKVRYRTNDIKYNMEAGFFAAMNMLDKRVEFRYIPFTPMRLGNTPVYFVGERNQGFQEVIINGSVEDRKFVAYYVYGNEVVGFVTVGYQNLHLYLWEAMKLLIMPPASVLRNKQIEYKDIVQQVLQLRPTIKCKRHDIVQTPSIMIAEFEKELEQSSELSKKVRQNIQQENEKQKKKFHQLKAKYDREGVEHVEDEMEMVDGQRRQPEEKATTLSGARKPGRTSSGAMVNPNNINMGTDNDNQNNPLSMILNAAKKTFKGG